jgi:hypothetical protein
VDPLTYVSIAVANVAAMSIFDWAALLFATCIAALAVVGELKVRCVLSLSSILMISGSICFVHG